jgi:hypothetical protein
VVFQVFFKVPLEKNRDKLSNKVYSVFFLFSAKVAPLLLPMGLLIGYMALGARALHQPLEF